MALGGKQTNVLGGELPARPSKAVYPRMLVAALPWAVLAPAFWLHWLPWWYTAPLFVALVLTEAWSEDIGRAQK